MSLWFKARRGPDLLVGTFLIVLLAVLLGDRSLQLPTLLGGGSASTRISTFLPLAIVALLSHGLSSRTRLQEQVALRRRGVWDLALTVGMLAAMTVALSVVERSTGGAIAGQFGRNSALLVAVALTVASRWSLAAGSAVAALLVVVTSSLSPYAPALRPLRVLQAPGSDRWALAVMTVFSLVAGWALLADLAGPLRDAERA